MPAADSFSPTGWNPSPWKEALAEIEVLKAENERLRESETGKAVLAVLAELDQLRDEVERLRADRDALRRDAERYRWLRTKGALRREAHIAVLTKNGGFVGEEEVVDAVIDAALAAKEGK